MFGLSIRSMLMGLFGAMALIIIGQGLFALNKIGAVNRSTLDIGGNWLPSVDSARTLAYYISRHQVGLARHLMAATDAERTEIEASLARVVASVAVTRKKYEPLLSSQEERALYQSFVGYWEQYEKEAAILLKASRANNDGEAGKLFRGSVYDASLLMVRGVEKMVALNAAGAKTSIEAAATNYSAAQLSTFAMIAVGALIAVAASMFVLVSICRPLTALIGPLDSLAKGNFSITVPVLAARTKSARLPPRSRPWPNR